MSTISAYEREQSMNARRRLLRVGDAVLVRSVKYPELAPWPATITAVNTAMVGALAPYYRVDNGTDQWVWWENVTPAD